MALNLTRFAWYSAVLSAAVVSAADAQSDVIRVTEPEATYLVRRVDLKSETMELFWKGDSGEPLKSFEALKAHAEAHQLTLVFAANAGMYEEDRSPVGLLVLNGKTVHPLNQREAKGNFYLKPNGVFLIDHHHHAHVIDSVDYPKYDSTLWATQSGPLLLKNGVIHPVFVRDSKNQLIRSGIGVTASGQVILVLSLTPVNFYTFAQYFQKLGCPNALFLDGTVSRFFTPLLPQQLEQSFGPMLAIVKKMPPTP